MILFSSSLGEIIPDEQFGYNCDDAQLRDGHRKMHNLKYPDLNGKTVKMQFNLPVGCGVINNVFIGN